MQLLLWRALLTAVAVCNVSLNFWTSSYPSLSPCTTSEIKKFSKARFDQNFAICRVFSSNSFVAALLFWRHCTCCVPSVNVHSLIIPQLHICTTKCRAAHTSCPPFLLHWLGVCMWAALRWWMTSVNLNFSRIPFSIRIKSFHLLCSTRIRRTIDARINGYGIT